MEEGNRSQSERSTDRDEGTPVFGRLDDDDR
jgi:hypothetical protein